MVKDFTLYLADEAATLAAGAQLANTLTPGLTIYLHGDLGAGKTTFVRGLLHGLGHVGKVKSPTYTLVEPYVISKFNIYHFDLYRFIDPEEWDAAGFRDYFNPQSICLIEWPEKAGSLIPQADLDVILTIQDTGRALTLKANSKRARQCAQSMISENQHKVLHD
ncbi:MAG: tRNA (adenosine(37)-N6)-threonylcarbamoyltransferase complex ATPase subunit type 1 TsaE, partial [Nitrosomonadales bacterium]|nr:tRNA (adenosine(37)-N6)-threonylcarbamoyltransferase complex ATPase subunit type 1 TsaE [Nitrosomonadales bacterium]